MGGGGGGRRRSCWHTHRREANNRKKTDRRGENLEAKRRANGREDWCQPRGGVRYTQPMPRLDRKLPTTPRSVRSTSTQTHTHKYIKSLFDAPRCSTRPLTVIRERFHFLLPAISTWFRVFFSFSLVCLVFETMSEAARVPSSQMATSAVLNYSFKPESAAIAVNPNPAAAVAATAATSPIGHQQQQQLLLQNLPAAALDQYRIQLYNYAMTERIRMANATHPAAAAAAAAWSQQFSRSTNGQTAPPPPPPPIHNNNNNNTTTSPSSDLSPFFMSYAAAKFQQQQQQCDPRLFQQLQHSAAVRHHQQQQLHHQQQQQQQQQHGH